MTRRWARTALAGVLAMSVLGGTGSVAVAQDDQITLNMIAMAQAGMTPDELNEVVSEFNQLHPNITVVADYVAYDALHDKIATGMAAGQAPFDIMLVDDIWFPEFASAGWLLDVTDRISSFDWDLDSVKDDHLKLSREMNREVEFLLALGPPPGIVGQPNAADGRVFALSGDTAR